MASLDKLAKRAAKAQATGMQRHVLVCTDGDCGGKSVAKAMRRAIARRGLRATVTVTKVDCLDICKGGTVAVVYPEGTWYGNLDEDQADRVVAEHLVAGRIVDDHVFLRNGLGPDGRGCPEPCSN